MRSFWSLWVLFGLLSACDDARRARTDPAERDAAVDAEVGAAADAEGFDSAVARPDAVVPDARLDDRGSPDAGGIDRGPPDGGDPDAGDPDVGEPDAGEPDVGEPDAGELDRGGDGGPADLGRDARLPVDAASDVIIEEPPSGFVEGEARAADQRLEVTVRVGAIEVGTRDGRFRIGPLPPGPTTLTLSAADHQTVTVEALVLADDVVQLEEPILLYRGVHLGERAGGLLRFSFDGRWLLWSVGDALWASPTGAPAPRVLQAQAFEAFLGFVPGRDAVVIRRRTRAGVAGDVDVIDLADGAREALFVEAQPWVRWRGPEALGMVETREALSRLELGRPGAPARSLAEGVPWLLVTELGDGRPVWAQARPDAPGVFEIWGGVGAAVPLAPGFTSGDAFLMNTPGRTGLLWLDPEARLIRWEPGIEPVVLADAVAASPRPRFLADGRLLFWRADEAPGLRQLHLLGEDGERLLVDGADGNTLRTIGDAFWIVRPDAGLWKGDLNGGGGQVLAGASVRYVTDGGGAVALADGVAWQVDAAGDAVRLPVDGLSQIGGVSTGATAWHAETGSLWYLPGPGRPVAAQALVEGAPRAGRVGEPGGRGLYVLGDAGYFRSAIPPDGAPTAFDVEVTTLTPVDADRLLGYQDGGWLHQVAPADGAAFGWAASVTRVVRSGQSWAVYVSDRGTFLAPIGE